MLIMFQRKLQREPTKQGKTGSLGLPMLQRKDTVLMKNAFKSPKRFQYYTTAE